MTVERSVFLDRDGVINVNRDDHVKSWEEFVFLPGAVEAIRSLSELGYRIFVVTNQAVVNRGMVSRAVVDEIHTRLCETIDRAGGHIDDVLYCPHRPEEHCGCRKPEPGLLLQAARKHGLDLSRCYMVGDTFRDVAAGQSVGCRAILVQTGRGLESLNGPDAARFSGYTVVADLLAAASLIGSRDQTTDRSGVCVPGQAGAASTTLSGS